MKIGLALALGFGGSLMASVALVAAPVGQIDSESRSAVVESYHSLYATGGQTAWSVVDRRLSASFSDDVLTRLNWFRALAGVPGSVRDDRVGAVAAQSLLTDRFSEEAQRSCVVEGSYGVEAVTALILGRTEGSFPASRQWLLSGRTTELSVGSAPATETKTAAGALYFRNESGLSGPAVPTAVAWPPSGFVPADVVSRVWSVQLAGADFSRARVSVTEDGAEVPVSLVSTDAATGAGAIAWTVAEGLLDVSGSDRDFAVSITGIVGPTAAVSYTTHLIDASRLSSGSALRGPGRVSTRGGGFQTETAEEASLLQVTSGRTLGGLGGDSSELTLAFSSVNELAQEKVVDGAWLLQDRAHLSFRKAELGVTDDTVLSLDLSRDGGFTWTEIWSESGGSADGFRTVGLSAWAGAVVSVRGRLAVTGPGTVSVGAATGVTLSEVAFGNALPLEGERLNTLAVGDDFILSAVTAGEELQPDATYVLRARGMVDGRAFGFGPGLQVEVIGVDGLRFRDWVAQNFPGQIGVSGDDDSDGDGVLNALEFAFGMNPLLADAEAFPRPLYNSGTGVFSLTFTRPGDVLGVSYEVELSEDLNNWVPLTVSQVGDVFRAEAPRGRERSFMRILTDVTE